MREDLIEVYKIMHDMDEVDMPFPFPKYRIRSCLITLNPGRIRAKEFVFI